MSINHQFDNENNSHISLSDLQKMVQYIKNEILGRLWQNYLRYVDYMRIKSLLDTLREPDDQNIPGFVWIKRKTSLDYLTSIQELCYDRRYEYKKLSRLFDWKRVLDVGCKYGDMSLYTNWNYTGIDVDSIVIEEAKKIWRGEFLVWDFLEYNEEKRFDLVVMSHILEHYKLDYCFKLLDKWFIYADKILVSIPSRFDRKKWHQQEWNSRESFEEFFSERYSLVRLQDTEEFSFNYVFEKK